MSDGLQTTLSGEVADVFAHHFVLRTPTGAVLVDLGPDGVRLVSVATGDHVEVTGDMKPSELKAARIAKAGGPPTVIGRRPPPGGESGHADPAAALRTVATRGFTVVGEPRREPRHFEILGRDERGAFTELHLEFDGTLRKSKVVLAGDGKWSRDVRQAG